MTSLPQMEERKEMTDVECMDSPVKSTASSGRQSKLFYFLIGGGIGAAAGLLLAPKPGAELRSDISEITRTGYDETLDLAQNVKAHTADLAQDVKAHTVDIAQNVKEHSADLYRTVKNKADRIYGVAAERLSPPDISGENVAGEANQVSGDILQLDDKMRSQPPDLTNKSTDIM